MSNREAVQRATALLQEFRPIALREMDGVQLLSRIDTKYVFPVAKLEDFLQRVKDGYRVLQTNPMRYTDYDSLYYDTPDFFCFRTHHRGKSGRYKIRFRGYEDTRMFFLEIKHKNNKGRTDKSRSLRPGIEHALSPESMDYIATRTEIVPQMLEPKLRVRFSRITMVNNAENERLTLDLNLTFEANGSRVVLPGIVVAEVKQGLFNSKSVAINALRDLRIRAGNMSKYCIGTAIIHPELRSNNFKEIIRSINGRDYNGVVRN
ncbi:MAG: polyphosphate polymerase domain-containing protein [Flavobacteriales bacterium]|nr:polyphosphate polymerase domain-containing protein [Flavobacteriales bacterium]